ncbi:MAG: hypothetical protein ACPGTP_09295 [Bacteroidia bacterium]
MKIYKIALLLVVSFFFSSAIADAGKPTRHSHDGRVHTHPLPSTGINHKHSTGLSESSEQWLMVSASGGSGDKYDYEYHIKKGVIYIENNSFTVIGRQKDNIKKTVNIGKWSVPVDHCKNEMGSFSIYTISGDHEKTSDFVFNCGSVVCTLAKITCDSGLILNK